MLGVGPASVMVFHFVFLSAAVSTTPPWLLWEKPFLLSSQSRGVLVLMETAEVLRSSLLPSQ